MMITLQSLQRDYAFFVRQAKEAYEKADDASALDCIRTAGMIAQTFCLQYADDELENLLSGIAHRMIRRKAFLPVKGRVVFYDSFARDNVMLTTQYLDALMSWDVEFLYLTAASQEELERQLFYKRLVSSAKARIVTVPARLPVAERLGAIVEAIEDFQPELALIHVKTEDLPGVMPWYTLPEVRRYYVEVTDHSFWFGTKAIDHCISFRDYGYSIALKYRGLSERQVLVQPFYPCVAEYPFEGLPAGRQDGVRLFSGGRITKIFGKSDAFLKMVKSLLEKYPNADFYFAGGGLHAAAARLEYIKRFIKKNGLTDRFHLLGQRKDIQEVCKHMDLFINTYPFGGGLMVQLAASCGLPVVILAKDGLCTSIEEYLNVRQGAVAGITYADEHDYYAALDKLITDKAWREREGQRLSGYVLSRGEFNDSLKGLLQSNENHLQPHIHEVDYIERRRLNIEAENNVLHRYHGILLRSRVLRRKRPFRYAREALTLLLKSDKKYLLGTVKRMIFKA